MIEEKIGYIFTKLTDFAQNFRYVAKNSKTNEKTIKIAQVT